MPTADVNLNDEMVKLVAYTIVSLKPDDERVMDGGEGTIIVTRNMSGDDFASWMLARYLQQEVETYGLGAEPVTKIRGNLIANDELKYLRVYFVVSTRWPREPRKFEERQIAVLNEIGRAIVG